MANETASSIFCRDIDGDGLYDLLMLSGIQNRAFGLLQRQSASVWPTVYDFIFPTGANPRHALVGDLDSDSLVDIAVSSARTDWSGSSLAIYHARTPVTPSFSNSNLTVWGNLSWESSAFGVGDLDGDGLSDIAAIYPGA